MEEFQKDFFRPLFTIIFRPKIVFIVTDSILRVKMMYESVKLDMLRKGQYIIFKKIIQALFMQPF